MSAENTQRYQFGDTVRIVNGFNMGSEKNPQTTTGLVGEVVDPTLYDFTPNDPGWVAVLFPGRVNPLFHLEKNVEKIVE